MYTKKVGLLFAFEHLDSRNTYCDNHDRCYALQLQLKTLQNIVSNEFFAFLVCQFQEAYLDILSLCAVGIEITLSKKDLNP